ncbi:hypothetical protein C0J52_20060 [Blattella germanica]|nr:hypothetical protein C0J52_20060 [Blattella germanica]
MSDITSAESSRVIDVSTQLTSPVVPPGEGGTSPMERAPTFRINTVSRGVGSSFIKSVDEQSIILSYVSTIITFKMDYNDEIRQEQMWEMQILNTQRGGAGGAKVGVAESTASSSSTGSMSPCTPPPSGTAESPPPPPGLVLAPQHPALRGLESRTTVAATTVTTAATGTGPPTQLVCRKRPLLPGGGTRLAMSPTKRTVLSILARARAAQAKDVPDYHHITNG